MEATVNDITRADVFAQTNDAEANELVAFTRMSDGRLENVGRYPTGGRGNGTPHLPSQGSIAIDGERLLVTNPGSDDVSLFAIGGEPVLVGSVASGGERPVSITIRGDRAYVLNAGSATIRGFDLAAGIAPLAGSEFTLAAGTDPAQISFSPGSDSLVVTD